MSGLAEGVSVVYCYVHVPDYDMDSADIKCEERGLAGHCCSGEHGRYAVRFR